MKLLNTINQLSRKRLTNDLVSLLLFLAACLIVVFLALLFLPLGLALFLLLFYIRREINAFPFFQDYSDLKTGALLESIYPEMRGILTPAISLATDYDRLLKSKENYSRSLIEAAISDAWERIAKGGFIRLNKILNRRLLKKSLISFLASVIILLISLIAFPTQFTFSFYSRFFPDKIPLTIDCEPKDIFTLPDKEIQIKIEIISPYKLPGGNLYLLSDNKRERHRLKFQNNTAVYKLYPKKEMAYYVSVLNRSSPVYSIRFIHPPELLSLTCILSPPSYTSLPPLRTDFPKEINCLKGTEIKVMGRANKRTAIAAFLKGKERSTEAYPQKESDTFSFSFKAVGDTVLAIRLTDAQGNEKLYPIRINYIPDENPFVRFLLPGRDMDIPEVMKIHLLLYALDDFGVRKVSIFAKMKDQEKFNLFSFYPNKKSDTLYRIWDLTQLKLLPGDELIYYAVVYDNDPYGPKSYTSPEYKLRFPTLAEIYSQTVKKREEIKSSLSSQLKESEKISEDIEDILSSLKKERKLSWEDKKGVERSLKKKEEILSALKRLQEEVKEVMEELLKSAVYDQETMEKLEELERLLSEILPKELKEEIAKLRERLLEKKEELSKILPQLKISSEELKKQLSRAIEILKRLQEEAKLKELARKLQEIEKQQKKIEEEIFKKEPEKLAEKERKIAEALKSWEKEMKELSLSEKEMQEELARIKEESERKLPSEMAEAIREKIRSGKLKEAKASAGELRKKLARIRRQLEELSQKMKKSREQEFIQKLQRYATLLCDITEYTEDLEKETKLKRDAKELIKKSQGISEGVENVADSIVALSRRYIQVSPRLADDLFKGASALEEGGNFLFEKNYYGGESRFSEAKVRINNTIQKILFLLALSRKGGMPGGMESFLAALSESLKEMAEMISEMGTIPIPLPSPLSGEQMATLERLLGRHRSIRERLEEMMKGLPDKPGLTSAMEGIIEEMKKIEEDMEKLNITRELVQREERVFQRLLDVERSIRKREAEEKREREVGKEFVVEKRPVLPKDLGERKRILQEELLRALQENYPREYYRLIKEYFDALLYE